MAGQVELPDDGGFLLLWRRFESHRYWQEKRTYNNAEAFLDCFAFQAAHSAHDKRVNGVTVHLERGQFLASVRFLSKRWNWGKGKVQRFLDDVRKADEIRPENETPAGTVYSIVNYETYQLRRDTERDGNGTATGQRRDKEKQRKTKKANRDTSPSWTVRAVEAWEEVYGRGTAGSMAGRIGKALKPLVEHHTESVVLEYWARYVRSTDGQFATPENFASRFAHWRKRMMEGGTAERMTAEYLATVLDMAGEAVWNATSRDTALNRLAAEYDADRWSFIAPFLEDLPWNEARAAKADKWRLKDVLTRHIERHAHAA